MYKGEGTGRQDEDEAEGMGRQDRHYYLLADPNKTLKATATSYFVAEPNNSEKHGFFCFITWRGRHLEKDPASGLHPHHGFYTFNVLTFKTDHAY